MPRLIPKDEALERIRREGGDFACLMCALRDGAFGPNLVLHDDDRALVILPRYVRRWGHVLLMLRPHLTSYSTTSEADWLHLCGLAHRAARAAEAALAPRRCYIASTGSSGGEHTNTSEHLHLHVVPIHDPDDRPASVFSWSEGIHVADDDEWQALLRRYREAWLASRSPGPTRPLTGTRARTSRRPGIPGSRKNPGCTSRLQSC